MSRCALIAIIIAILIGTTPPVHSATADRCRDYLPDVRAQHLRWFGPAFPWWYGLGQLRQESGCRATVTAFDHGQGIAQFMPATAAEIRRLMRSPTLNPYNPEHAIRMQAYYMARLHRRNPAGALWMTYQAYNGGWGTLKAEMARAGGPDRKKMRAACRRKIIPLKRGRTLNLCDVNYDYAVRIHRYGQTWRTAPDGMRYW
ncbi:MAG: transglycosylase SLT domain-containing protein [Syntrophales bacterium]|jgi:hypothetical protein|nr:lytic transglycosylase domain-containing protein [Dehalococcoidia bacterium]MDD4339250.1 transglycosylase SLT domain-containing protein [Syntrophales bacterium]